MLVVLSSDPGSLAGSTGSWLGRALDRWATWGGCGEVAHPTPQPRMLRGPSEGRDQELVLGMAPSTCPRWQEKKASLPCV